MIEIIKYSNCTFCLVCEREEEILAVGLFSSPYLIFCMVRCLMPIATVGPCCTFLEVASFSINDNTFYTVSPCLTVISYLSFLIRQVAQLR